MLTKQQHKEKKAIQHGMYIMMILYGALITSLFVYHQELASFPLPALKAKSEFTWSDIPEQFTIYMILIARAFVDVAKSWFFLTPLDPHEILLARAIHFALGCFFAGLFFVEVYRLCIMKSKFYAFLMVFQILPFVGLFSLWWK